MPLSPGTVPILASFLGCQWRKKVSKKDNITKTTTSDSSKFFRLSKRIGMSQKTLLSETVRSVWITDELQTQETVRPVNTNRSSTFSVDDIVLSKLT